jgi:hypothetical protein
MRPAEGRKYARTNRKEDIACQQVVGKKKDEEGPRNLGAPGAEQHGSGMSDGETPDANA